MSNSSEQGSAPPPPPPPTGGLPFPPLKKTHIMHCSYHYWHPKYRSATPKARLIPLSEPFVNYLRADGIFLPPQDENTVADDDSGVYSISEASDYDDGDDNDPSVEWQEIHAQIKETIAELGGMVAPKLNWSAPKDATWMSATNDMECRTPNDIYLLLKSSDFVTHDLEHAFDDCVSDGNEASQEEDEANDDPREINIKSITDRSKIPYHLVLRKYINLNPSLEFRCFVRDHQLLCICQRDLNNFEFLFGLRDGLRRRIQSFFDTKLKSSFPDPNFVFDVYIPAPHNRVWLMDINPWAQRTDPLLFSWLEILEIEVPNFEGAEKFNAGSEEEYEDEEADEDLPFIPEFRLVGKDDPEAYNFSTPRYSAHKLPREVVDASMAGPGGMGEFLGQWQDVLAKKVQEDNATASDEE
ncbi:cell division cycle protein 123 [Polytolypa hystricis UAMH7299]|uniref:Cell division cycle protein 123 n=1 Tax=Polytolypa hystricis (strain UAMH7299) TaxID=1447883 RepID=A0A2B7Y891_POLH7|nr:cell division cycle protein 123 [Polytolypa hystricis UAMH7299]